MPSTFLTKIQKSITTSGHRYLSQRQTSANPPYLQVRPPKVNTTPTIAKVKQLQHLKKFPVLPCNVLTPTIIHPVREPLRSSHLHVSFVAQHSCWSFLVQINGANFVAPCERRTSMLNWDKKYWAYYRRDHSGRVQRWCLHEVDERTTKTITRIIKFT